MYSLNNNIVSRHIALLRNIEWYQSNKTKQP